MKPTCTTTASPSCIPTYISVTAGVRTAVSARQLHGSEREVAWRQIVAAVPRFERYQEKTDRELPVIRLTARPSP